VLLTDSNATLDALRTVLGKGSSVIHIAAHGQLDRVAPAMSSIILSGSDRLTLAGLADLELNADLAILSACDSGRGAATMGGELIGLSRALLLAGVRRCLVSLWPVNDITACVLMEAFHRHVHRAPPAEALFNAQQEIRVLTEQELLQRYADFGGEVTTEATARRRGRLRRGLQLDAEFSEDVLSDDPQGLDGKLPLVWAPFVLVGC
jgi:CHAT domain-containing protein